MSDYSPDAPLAIEKFGPPVERDESTVEPDYIEVHASELQKVLNANRSAERYLKALNEMNAALHLEEPAYSPLTTSISNAVKRLEAMLEGFNAKLKEREEADGAV